MSEQNQDRTPSPGRRALLAGGAAAALGVLLAPGIRLIEIGRANAAEGVTARAAGTTASSAVRWGMLIDATLCRSDCDACVGACNREVGLTRPSAPTDSQWVRKIEIKEVRTGKEMSLPMMCQHCAKPPCVDVCPTGASFKRADGIVLVDRHICIGCRYCMMACPYKARSFVHEPLAEQNPEIPRGKGCVEGCTMCVHRVDKGQLPACVEACPTGAIVFGDLNDPESLISQRIRSIPTTQVRAELGIDTGIRYHGI